MILLHPRKGRLMTMGNTLSQAVAVAALTDLLVSGLIIIEEGKVKVKKLKFTGKVVNDAMIRRIYHADKPHTFKYWSGKFFFKGNLFLKEALKDLVQRNILYAREHRFLIIPVKRYLL